MSSIRELTSDELNVVSGGEKAESHHAKIGPLTLNSGPGYFGINIAGVGAYVSVTNGVVILEAGKHSLWLE